MSGDAEGTILVRRPAADKNKLVHLEQKNTQQALCVLILDAS